MTHKLTWEELETLLIGLRGQIKKSEIRPDNWENILMRPIIKRMKDHKITTLDEWKQDSIIHIKYLDNKKIMDEQLGKYWHSIEVLLNFWQLSDELQTAQVNIHNKEGDIQEISASAFFEMVSRKLAENDRQVVRERCNELKDIALILSELDEPPIKMMNGQWKFTDPKNAKFTAVKLTNFINECADEVIDKVLSESPIRFEKLRCYKCKASKHTMDFQDNCFFEKLDGDVIRNSLSPCKSCLRRYWAAR